MSFALINNKIIEGEIKPSLLGVIGELLFVTKLKPIQEWSIKPGILFDTLEEAEQVQQDIIAMKGI